VLHLQVDGSPDTSAAMSRTIDRDYTDPLDLIWARCAERLGWVLERSDDVFASWDGRRVLTLCHERHYDPDDSLAQLVFHEICHALVQGPTNRRRTDWGLDNVDDARAAVAEHGCHRLQAALADRYGLRAFLAVTTDWRSYWDALPADSLAPGDDPAIALARAAWPDAMRGPWSAPLHEALEATAQLADVVRASAPPNSLWALTRPLQAAGAARRGSEHCGTCAWRQGGCCVAASRSGDPIAVGEDEPACIQWEPVLDLAACRACGACCRQGFHHVGVDDDEPIASSDLVRRTEHGGIVPRPDGFCVALAAHRSPWTCTVYAQRPRACSDFEIAGEHCLSARRRVGLSRLG
jgi:hypothetical protein